MLKKNRRQKSAIVEKNMRKISKYLEEDSAVKSSEIAATVGLGQSGTRDYLKLMSEEGIIVAQDGRKDRVYCLALDKVLNKSK